MFIYSILSIVYEARPLKFDESDERVGTNRQVLMDGCAARMPRLTALRACTPERPCR